MDDSTQPAMEPVQPPAPEPSDPAGSPAAAEPTTAGPAGWQPPANVPPASQPPAEQPAWAIPARRPMPGSVVGAAVILLVLGVLTGLMAALFLLSGSIYDQLPDSAFGGLSGDQLDRARELSRGFGVGLGIVAGVIALGHLASGAGIFRRAGWARVIGMVVAGLGVLFTGLLSLVFIAAVSGGVPVTSFGNSGLTPEQVSQAMRVGAILGLVIFGVGLLSYLFTLVALIRNGRAFA